MPYYERAQRERESDAQEGIQQRATCHRGDCVEDSETMQESRCTRANT